MTPELVGIITIGIALTALILRQGETLRIDLGKRIDGQDKRFDDLDRRFDDMGKRFDDMGKRIDDMGKRIDDMGRRIDDLGARVGVLKKEVAALKATVETFFRVRIDRPEPPPEQRHDQAA